MNVIQASGFAAPCDVEARLTQIRVHELASELNVSTQQVLTVLEDLGKKVRGPSTVIGISVAAKVRGRFRSPKSPAHDASAGEVVTGAPEAVHAEPLSAEAHSVRPAVPSVARSAADAISQSLFLPPVAQPTAPVRTPSTGIFANPFAVPSTTAAPPARPAASAGESARQTAGPVASRPLVSAAPQPRNVGSRAVSESTEPLVAEPQPDYDAQWERRGISQADRESWIKNGLRLADAGIADRCDSAGIAPSDLPIKLSGRTALQRLRDGEATTSVWARLREAEQQPRRAGTKLTGRFQLS